MIGSTPEGVQSLKVYDINWVTLLPWDVDPNGFLPSFKTRRGSLVTRNTQGGGEHCQALALMAWE